MTIEKVRTVGSPYFFFAREVVTAKTPCVASPYFLYASIASDHGTTIRVSSVARHIGCLRP